MRRRRLQLDLTRDQLAQAADVSNALIEHYEAGRKRCQAQHLRRIADALGVGAAYFFGDLDRRYAGFPKSGHRFSGKNPARTKESQQTFVGSPKNVCLAPAPVRDGRGAAAAHGFSDSI
jgi:transcriptional regulator with XRE-family HTH domain